VSAESAAFYQAGIKCDHAGCNVTIWRVAVSQALASMIVQQDAKASRWSVAADRSVSDRDLCPDHARAARDALQAWASR